MVFDEVSYPISNRNHSLCTLYFVLMIQTVVVVPDPLLYVIRADATVPNEVDDPLTPLLAYDQSGSLLDERSLLV